MQLNLLNFRAIKRGKLTAPGPPDALQAMCYLPDWARAAVQLSEKRAELNSFEDIPFPGHSFTVLELQDSLQDHLGRSISITGFSLWMFTLLAPVWELAREMNEMRYLWNTSHQLSGSKLNRLLPEFLPTDWHRAMFASLPDNIRPNKQVPLGRTTAN